MDYIKSLFIPIFLWVANVSFIKETKFLDFFAAGVKNSRIHSLNLQSSCRDNFNQTEYDVKLPSYITGYSNADLARIQKNDPEVGTVIKWKESGN